VWPKINEFPLVPGSGVVGYFTTQLLSSSSKLALIKSSADMLLGSIIGTSNHRDGITILFTGGRVLNAKG
jgi:hypothetical protein